MAIYDINGNELVQSGLVSPNETDFMTIEKRTAVSPYKTLIGDREFIDVTAAQHKAGIPFGYITNQLVDFAPGDYWFYSIYKTVSGQNPKLFNADFSTNDAIFDNGVSGFWDGTYNEYHNKRMKNYQPNQAGYMVGYHVKISTQTSAYIYVGAGGQCFVLAEPGYTYLFHQEYNPLLDTTDDVTKEYLFVAEGYSDGFTKKFCEEVNPSTLGDALPITAQPVSRGKYWYHIGDSNSDWMGGKVLGDQTDKGFLLTVARKNGIAKFKNTARAGATWGERQVESDKYCATSMVDKLVDSGEKPDIITFLMGTNSDLDIGTVTDLPTNKATTCGAVKYCLEKLLAAFPYAAVGVMLPMQRAETFKYQEEKNALIEEVCRYYSIPTIDLFHAGHIIPDSKLTIYPHEGSGVLYVDAAHITQKVGVAQLGRIISEWLNTI